MVQLLTIEGLTKLSFGKIELVEIAKSVSQVSAVCNGCVSTFSGSIFAEESKSEVGVHNGTRQCALRHILRPFFFYLSSLLSVLGM